MASDIHYQFGLPEGHRAEAARLYDQAFGAKFAVAVPDAERRIQLLQDALLLPFAIAALSEGKLAGLAGFQTAEGSLTAGISAQTLFKQLGIWGGVRAAAVFSLFERKAIEGELVMDGIAVSEEMRGRGIGSKLLALLKTYAGEQGYTQIRLDVIDTNPDARRLYERKGFKATKTEEFSFLKPFIGFSAATTMVFQLPA